MTPRAPCPITGAVLLAGLALAACGKAEPRSVLYFAAHLDEARTIVSQCRDGSVRGAECANAYAAVQDADSRAGWSRFRST